jgi:hypothetical protein
MHETPYSTVATIAKQANAMQMLYPVLYPGASESKKEKTAMIPPMLPNPTCHADATDLLAWLPMFILNQHTMNGMVL